MNTRVKYFLLAGLLCCGAAICISTEWYAYRTNGAFGFPLDDPWIHLQFAKNLHDYGAFSYYKNEMVTSGSTSPLYTFLLTAGFFFTENEMVVSYVLGIFFLTLAGYLMFKLSMNMFEKSFLIASAAVIFLLVEPRLVWIALSGMETTLFISLLLMALLAYRLRHGVLLGIAGGLLLWTRPEALLFCAVLAVDVVYQHYLLRTDESRKKAKATPAVSLSWVKMPLLIVATMGIGYGAFNLLLSGSVMPNTYAAKVAYYSSGTTDFPTQVFHFITGGHLLILALFTAVAAVGVIYRVVRREQAGDLVPLLWSLGLFLAYWNKLPYLYQEGRYLMPLLPFVILLGLSGTRTSLELARRAAASLRRPKTSLLIHAALLGVIGVQFVQATLGMRVEYADYCKYINDRQVKTAMWLRDNTPEQAIIATHDIGAVAFYSGRRIADMVGLVSPEMIQNIGKLDKLKQFLVQKRVTHLAVLRNWFEVVNQNAIYQTDEKNPEIMEVFEFDPVRTHITPRDAGYLADAAGYYFSLGNAQQAVPLLEQSLRLDPYSSKARLLHGRVLLSAGKLSEAETEIKASLQLHASYWDAEFTLAQLSLRRNKPEEAVAQLEAIVQENPSYAAGYGALAKVYKSFHLDSLRAEQYLLRYQELVKGEAK